MKLLLVEDDESIGQVLLWWLSSYPVETYWAKTIRQACDYLETTKPDHILMDLYLDGEYGLRVVDQCKLKYQPMPPIILMTAVSHSERYTENYQFEHIVKKPFHLEELEKALHLIV